jgi:hypothetical protein
LKTNNANHSAIISEHTPVHPSIFTLLILPLGIMTGYITVTLAYLFSKEGIQVEKVAALVAGGVLSHIFKFIWAPLLDSMLSLKKWYLIANVISALGILAMLLCLLGGWICDRMKRQNAYLLFGLLGALCAAPSNAPIYLMIYIDGWAYAHWGAMGMLNIEAAFAVLAIILFLLLQTFMRGGRKMEVPAILPVPNT